MKEALPALQSLGQETRLAVYRLLVEAGPTGLSAGAIAAAVAVPPATLSFHLNHLAVAELVQSRRVGRSIVYAANFATMNALLGFMTENCCRMDGQSCEPGQAPPTVVDPR